MVLMIWVNDFWTLSDIPYWLKHMPADEDALGFSDVIFPAFLFIVGLSIPHANRAKLAKGDSTAKIAKHILLRSAALILMGVTMVNLESYHEGTALLPKSLWQVLMIIAFFLIWNRYIFKTLWKFSPNTLRVTGWCLLAALIVLFRSDPSNGYNWIEPHWWGILGLIGWSYLICSLIELAFKNSTTAIATSWLLFVSFNIAAFASWLDPLSSFKNYVWLISDGSLPAITMAGCLVSTIMIQMESHGKRGAFLGISVAFGFICLIAGLFLRAPWGISKIYATPAWTEICTGISVLSFVLIFWIADMKGKTDWANFLKPAGTATLTCYLLPYLVYPLLAKIGFELPSAMSRGFVGLATSMGFALLVVYATGWLNRGGIKLGV